MSSTLRVNQKFALSPLNSRQFANICGALHENIRLIEHFFKIRIEFDHNEVILFGNSDICFKDQTEYSATQEAFFPPHTRYIG